MLQQADCAVTDTGQQMQADCTAVTGSLAVTVQGTLAVIGMLTVQVLTTGWQNRQAAAAADTGAGMWLQGWPDMPDHGLSRLHDKHVCSA